MVLQILQIAASCACNGDYSPINQANTTILNTHRATYTAAYPCAGADVPGETHSQTQCKFIYSSWTLLLKDPSYLIKART